MYYIMPAAYRVHIILTALVRVTLDVTLLIRNALECDLLVGAADFHFISAKQDSVFIRNLCLALQIYTINMERFKMEGDKHVHVLA